jgi:hypothetical protein
MRAAPQCFVLLLGVSLAACGPIYLHDPAGEAAATAARTQFQETLVKGRLSDLVGTYRVQNAEQAVATRALQKDDVRNATYTMSAKPWAELFQQTTVELDETKKANKDAEAALQDIQTSLAEALGAHEAADTQVDAFLKALNAAADAELRHAASQKLLAAGLQAIVSRQGNGGAGKKALQEVLDTTLTRRFFEVDPRTGGLVEKTEPKKIRQVPGVGAEISSAVLAADGDPVKTAQAVLKGIQGLENFEGLQIGDPGIAVTIVGLGYDVARAEERRLAAMIDEAQRTRALYRDQRTFLDAQEKRLARNLVQVGSLDECLKELKLLPGVPSPSDSTESCLKKLKFPPKVASPSESPDIEEVIVRLRELAVKSADEEDRRTYRAILITLYRQLGDNLQFRVIDAQARSDFENAVAVVKTERALMQTEINLREREAVIIRGLDGLVAFQQGGIDADDVRNLIMLAQAIGIFAIAAQ